MKNRIPTRGAGRITSGWGDPSYGIEANSRAGHFILRPAVLYAFARGR